MTNDFIDISRWGNLSIEDNKIYCWKTDNLKILIKKELENIKIYQYNNDNDNNTDIDNIIWQEWQLKDSVSPIINILPVFPDKTLVLTFNKKLNLLKKQKKVLNIIIPIWVKLEIQQENSTTELITIPITKTFKGWFGDLSDGELCYYIDTELYNESINKKELHLLKLPISLINNSEMDNLILEKFAISPKYLGIFQDKELNLLSNNVHVIFKQDGDISIAVSNLNKKNTDNLYKEISPKLIDKKVFYSINIRQIFNTYNLPTKK